MAHRLPHAAISVASLVALPRLTGFGSRAQLKASGVPPPQRLRPIHLMALAAAFASAGGIGMRSILVVFAVGVGFTSADAGMLLAALGVVALASRIGFGVFGDRRRGDALQRAAALMVLSAVGGVPPFRWTLSIRSTPSSS